MLNRRILLIVLSILFVGGAVGSLRSYTVLRGQFGGGFGVNVPLEVLDQLCGLPLESNPEMYGDGTKVRGPVDGPGCNVRYQSGQIECKDGGPCNGSWEKRSNYQWQEMGDCIYKYTASTPDCALPPEEKTLEHEEFCPVGGIAQVPVEWNCCADNHYRVHPEVTNIDDVPEVYGKYDWEGETYYYCRSNQFTVEQLAPYNCNIPTFDAPQPCGEHMACTSNPYSNYYQTGTDGKLLPYSYCECSWGPDADGKPVSYHWDKEEEACVPPVPFEAPRCGDGIKQNNEQCDDGENNVPIDIANKPWLDIESEDVPILKRSSCLSTCVIAQCSDTNLNGTPKDNDGQNRANADDYSCNDGAYGSGTYLKGYNVEKCPFCQKENEKDGKDSSRTVVERPVLTALAAGELTTYQWEWAEYNDENIAQQYCRGGRDDITGGRCLCTSDNTIRMNVPVTDDDGRITAFSNTTGFPHDFSCAPTASDALWTWSCHKDADCAEGYRCAYYSIYRYLEKARGRDLLMYRCRKLVEEGDKGCRSRWDCKDNYKSLTTFRADNNLDWKDPTPFKCIASNATDVGKCCGKDTPECKRQGFIQSPVNRVPDFSMCPKPGNAGGGDGGGDAGDEGSGGNDGNDTGGGSNSAGNGSSSSSAAACFDRNPCLGVTAVNGRSGTTWSYTIPPQCPLTGNKRTCYAGCVNDLNREVGDDDAKRNFESCMANRCRIDEAKDLNMCPCNPDHQSCFLACADQHGDCRALCAYDPNPTACRTECSTQQRQCIAGCGRQCPVSSSLASLSARSLGSGGSSAQSTTSGKSIGNSSSSSKIVRSSSANSASACSERSLSSVECAMPSPTCSIPPGKGPACDQKCVDDELKCRQKWYAQQSSVRMINGCSTGPTLEETCTIPRLQCQCNCMINIDLKLCSSMSSQTSSKSASSVRCLKGDVCMNYKVCHDQGGTLEDPGYCGGSVIENWCCHLPGSSRSASFRSASTGSVGSNGSNGSNTSNGSSTSSVNNGVCCEAGGCNPFGSCTRPYPNYESCKAACGSSNSSRSNDGSSRSSSSSSSRSSSSSSHSDGSSRSSSSSSQLSSSSSSSSSRSSSSSSNSDNSSSSSRSSYRSSYSSNDDGGTTGGTISGTTGIGGGISGTGIGGATGTSGIGGSFGDTTAGIGGSIGGTTNGNNGGNGGIGNEGDSCRTNQDCRGDLRCILGRCLSVMDIVQLPAFCGNARLDRGEQCDDGSANSDRPNAACRPDCTRAGCGDGIIDTPLEQCDDSNTVSNDGCSSSCLPERAAPTALPATTIELPFTNKGDLGSTAGDQGSEIGDREQIGPTIPTGSSLPSSVPSTPDTGPAALAVMIAGGAAGWLYRRRK